MNLHLPTPVCAVCGRAVDTMVTRSNPMTNCIDVVVRCHGEEERMSLPQIEFVSANAINSGIAFRDSKRIRKIGVTDATEKTRR